MLLATPAADDNSTFGSASVPLAAHDANTASGDVTDTSPKSVLSTLSAEAQAEVQDYQEIIDELNETISALEANRGLVSEMVKDALPTGDAALSAVSGQERKVRISQESAEPVVEKDGR